MILQQTIEQILARGDKAFIPYIMAGDGGLETLKPTILKLQQLGVSAIEIGIPFTDPVADGPTIEKAGERALAHGVTLRNVLAELSRFADDISVPLVAMTYLNPILAYGIEAFARDAYAAGIRGLIVPDMPLEESALLHPALKTHGIALVQLVSLTSPLERVKKLAAASEGFIYAVTVNGTTGIRAEFAENLQAHFKVLKQHSAVPILAGFGISTPEHVKNFSAIADGVIVGSQIVAALEQQDWTTIESLVHASKKVTVL
ncbi:tryptophan synthase subunit alpha [Solibacillus sp. R5-41]|uniref:tryptophan synthase subunit alpha n=1 Tax=Solibacillus sp. R5-41 TaxID=2048654 RepID=UPI000C127DAE|nr:tryptophan synthase subunit alpha [Solibacillus sp. R5-41]ATP38900.1 tryptophan synthase subunit alpha [Solibacillus sp. R5-41]